MKKHSDAMFVHCNCKDFFFLWDMRQHLPVIVNEITSVGKGQFAFLDFFIDISTSRPS